MGFLERLLGSLMGDKFVGHHGGYRGDHHGGSGMGAMGIQAISRMGSPATPASSAAAPCARCQLLPAMRRFLGSRPMFRLRRGIGGVRGVGVFGAAQPYQAYLSTNRRGNRLKVLVHDGFGVWPAVRRLHRSRFLWAAAGSHRIALTREQFDALVPGLP